MENKVLGKGLSALIPEKTKNDDTLNIQRIKVSAIKDNRFQPRTNYDDAKLEELKASIKEKGVLQPILVRESNGGFEVIAGERRLRAVRALGLDEVPVIVKNVSDQEALVLALIENIQREELNPIEEAQAFKRLLDEFGFSQEAVADAVGKDRSTISNLLRLLKLSDEIQQSVYKGDISVGHARALLAVESIVERNNIFGKIVDKGLSVREVENLISHGSKRIPRKTKSATEQHPQIVALEEVLQKFLGTKVRIMAQRKRGKIVIDYYSPQDLERILKIIKK